MTDWLSRSNAEKLAKSIAAFWRDMGYVVEARVEPMEWDDQQRISGYQVRTDLIGGMPRRRA